ncbi:RNA polymerase sigma factor [Larkinella humicola]|uniref:Sigma-70 family RNA polymerase sigma factor n=1 Tax=Larkinella humicola TaxID=2607654 RepID=A0A5N1J8X5_9BACT|nr:sigma-70 family RNA polymerase sigma factor [Larkinella humicola]KAA9346634.1 sigma-70 family RNA polymerase sigma factor [Larkinella humicola]
MFRSSSQNRPSESPTDAALWHQFREGDEVALGELAERYYKRLYGYGSKFSRDREAIKDCIQDLFLEIWDKRHTISEPDSVKLYLLVSIRRRILRRKTGDKWLEQSEELDFDAAVVGDLPIETAIIEDETSQHYVRKLQQLIPQLSRRQQEIIYLRFYENLDNEAIAEVMSLSRGAVANLLWRALKELKEYWYAGLLLLMIPGLYLLQ